MEQVKYEFDDFFAIVGDEDKGFVAKIHEMLLQKNHKVKIATKGKKTVQFTVTYSEAKTRRNMAKFSTKKNGLSVQIYTRNYDKYLDVLSGLPVTMISQMSEAYDCKNLVKLKPGEKTCSWEDCSGYDFHIGKTHFQKCSYYSFEFNVEAESVPFLHGIIEAELNARATVEA